MLDRLRYDSAQVFIGSVADGFGFHRPDLPPD